MGKLTAIAACAFIVAALQTQTARTEQGPIGKSTSGRADLKPILKQSLAQVDRDSPRISLIGVEGNNISGVKVLHLMVLAAGGTDITFAETSAAFGLGLAFCYKHDNFAPPFSCNVGLMGRVTDMTGYRFDIVWPKDPEEAWTFMKEALLARNPVKMAGPEDSIVRAFREGSEPSGREVWALGVGGPALEGRVGSEALERHVKRWAHLPGGGIYRFSKRVDRDPPRESLRNLAQRSVDWQEKHPGVGVVGGPETYGISAFEQFMTDLQDTTAVIRDEYLNCWAINFQINARHALSDYFKQASVGFGGDLRAQLESIAGEYRLVAESLGQFVERDLGVNRGSNEAQQQIQETVGVALQHERAILGKMERLLGAL